MLSASLLVAAALAYIGLLFLIAWLGDRRAARGAKPFAGPWVYSLSLAVYCTAWTFYGSVGRAADDGYGFLPIYLGPTLGAVLGWVIYRKILRIAKAERLISIADFIASRYGKSTALGAVVAVMAVVGTVPYIALQLKAVASSFELLWRSTHPRPLPFDQLSLLCAALLAVFAILFGTRSVDLTEHHSGLVLAIAFESLVKLVAFLAVGWFVVWRLHGGLGELFARAAADPKLRTMLARTGSNDGDWAWMTFLSLLAFWFLPRQFHVGIVENVDERHLRTSAWLLPLYLLVINLFVLPIALAGRLATATAGVSGDSYVLALPLAAGRTGLAVFVFLGGLSAATGMVIVESLALSNMVASDLVLPWLLRRAGPAGGDFRSPLLVSRRLAIVGVLLLGHFYAVFAGNGVSLVTIGLISFAAAAQVAPALLGGLYWRGATRNGALAGLIGGFLVWGYTLTLPTLAASGLLSQSFVDHGPWGMTWLRPSALFGLEGLDPLSHSLVWSLLVNVIAFIGISSLGGQTAVEVRQAHRFVDVFRLRESEEPVWSADTPVASVRELLARFLGESRTESALQGWAQERGADLQREVYADPELLAYAELLLAGTTGAASARVALTTVAQEQSLDVGQVVELLDETSRALATSRDLAEKSQQLEAASAELLRVNERLRELDKLKDDYLSTMAHELRTPLAAIRAFAEILHDNPDLPVERRAEFLRIIEMENDRLSRLIHDLLDLAKLEAGDEAGNQELALNPFGLAEAVGEAVESLRQLSTVRGVAVEYRRGGDPLALHGDRDRLIQVVVNLLSNAIKFCPPKIGRVVVAAARRAAGRIEISVSDNGPGVPAADRETIFERFRQLSRPAGAPAGTGLGLPICRRIVAQHGGRIWVEDAAALGGARFVVLVPIAPGEIAANTSREAMDSRGGAEWSRSAAS
ncbi:MAG TPA: sensor histidine kinase [Thermoanaerobaculia bacterium]|nr:sensor histidine kinase [Thermoanaerobaculia bacterium]